MKKDPTTFGLSPEKLAYLWNIGPDAGPQKDDDLPLDERRGTLLRDWLASSPAPIPTLFPSMSPELCQICQKLQLFGEEPLGRLLQNPGTDVSTIEAIKRLSKQLVTHADSEIENDIATVIYYAAIAHALVFHDRRITSFSYERLGNAFAALGQNTWLTPGIAALLENARCLCAEKMKSQR